MSTVRRPFFSVCVPAYNRAGVLLELLHSVLQQKFTDYEIVICEDCSPERKTIGEIVRKFVKDCPGVSIRYIENSSNLGYDGNFRELIAQSRGHYCYFLGNDDLMAPNALETIHAQLCSQQNIGVVLRSYATFSDSPERPLEVFRYFPEELLFPAGAGAIVTFYRRCVVISGLVLHRDASHRLATDEFDGTLLYQLHLVANLLAEMDGLSLPDVLALYRTGGVPDFGHSPAEQGKFQPRQQTPESSLEFVRGMLRIAMAAEKRTGLAIYAGILADLSAYSLPLLSIQRTRPMRVFLKYARDLSRLGLGLNPYFITYLLSLTFLGKAGTESIVVRAKRILGSTPAIGHIYKGERVSRFNDRRDGISNQPTT